MQVLKDDIKSSIKKAALYEFMQNGYEKASIRAIASRANVSVGNLYHYFQNKENLFNYLVSPVYEELNEMAQKKDYDLNFLYVNFMEETELVEHLKSIHLSYREELFLLLLRSRGTKYEHAKENLIVAMEKKLNHFFDTVVNKDKTVIKGIIFSKALATSLIEGICTILEEADDDKTFIENIIQYMEFTFKNIMRSVIDIRDNKIKFRRINHEEIYSRFNHCGNNRSNRSTTNHESSK